MGRSFELLEDRRVLTSTFVVHDILVGDIDVFQPQSVAAADIDGDGHLDMLSADLSTNQDFTQGSIAWYRNIGDASFERRQVVDLADSITVAAADIDSDGDQDIVSTIASDLTGVVWYENLDGNGNEFAEPQLLLRSIARTIVTGDFDNDGDSDLILGEDRRIRWLENKGNLEFEEHSLVSSVGSRHIEIVDVNEDALGDIVTVLRDGRLAMIPRDVETVFGEMEVLLSPNATSGGAYGLTIGDFDDDSEIEIYFAYTASSRANSTLAYLENIDGVFAVVSEQQLPLRATSLLHADPNADGITDLLAIQSGLSPDLGWFTVTNTGVTEENQRIGGTINVASQTGLTADLDSDGQNDIVLAGSTSVGNLGPGVAPVPAFLAFIGLVRPSGIPNDFIRLHLLATQGDGADSLASGDIDNDGDIDLLGASFNDGRLAWYRNEGENRFSDQVLITAIGRPSEVQLVNLDDDSDLDLLVTSRSGVLWYSNDGDGNFRYVERLGETFSRYAEPVDFDGDGDLDVLVDRETIAEAQTHIEIFLNDGRGTFNVIPVGNLDEPLSGSSTLADLDADGDLDVVTPTGEGITWYENTDSGFASGKASNTNFLLRDKLFTFDVDGDGVSEIVSSELRVYQYASESENWNEWSLGLGDVTEYDFVIRTAAAPLDYDGDGDLDLVAAVRRVPDQTVLDSIFDSKAKKVVLLYERGDDGQLLEPVDLGEIPFDGSVRDFTVANGFVGADFDGDKDVDFAIGKTIGTTAAPFAAPYGGIELLENRLPGDANDDNRVDFADFLALSSAFGTDEASWEDGDFNNDQVVDFADFLIVSQQFGKVRG